MAVALEINFALWIMLGCAAVKALQLIEYFGWSSKHPARQWDGSQSQSRTPTHHGDCGCAEIGDVEKPRLPFAPGEGRAGGKRHRFSAHTHNRSPKHNTWRFNWSNQSLKLVGRDPPLLFDDVLGIDHKNTFGIATQPRQVETSAETHEAKRVPVSHSLVQHKPVQPVLYTSKAWARKTLMLKNAANAVTISIIVLLPGLKCREGRLEGIAGKSHW
jgi:hypothetical protein